MAWGILNKEDLGEGPLNAWWRGGGSVPSPAPPVFGKGGEVWSETDLGVHFQF